MHELDTPPAPSIDDVRDQLAAGNAAFRTASDRRREIEAAIRTTTDIRELSRLHDQWGVCVEQMEAANNRCRELEMKLAEMN